MSIFKIKRLPPIRLVDLLKKRRITFVEFIKNSGIISYQTLVQKCQKLGVSCPSEQEFKEAVGGVFSSPQEGVIVLDPPVLIKDSGEKVQVDSFVDHDPLPLTHQETPVTGSDNFGKSTKKSKKKLLLELVETTPEELTESK